MVDLRVKTITGADGVLEEETVGAFKSSLRDALIREGDDGYEQARMVWNGNIDRRPALIARCAGVGDVNVLSQWTEAGESEHHTAWTRQVWGRFEPLISGAAYVNHIAGDDKPEKVRASSGENDEKLVALKDKYDPTNMFQLNPNIKPSG